MYVTGLRYVTKIGFMYEFRDLILRGTSVCFQSTQWVMVCTVV